MTETRSQQENNGGYFRKETVAEALAKLPQGIRTLFIIALFIFCITSFGLLAQLNNRYLVEIPEHGGELAEGIIGRPRFINPVIAKSDVDRDMASLVYSGLIRTMPSGEIIPDLAEHYEVSADGLTYTFTLRNELYWHDGEPVTAADVAFTIEKVRDAGLAIKSPRRASWEGVDVETPDQKTVVFRIKQSYAPFLENATMGIIPKHIWQNIPNEEFDVTYYNIEPIGSGPYRVENIVRDNEKGLPQYYDLVAFKRYALGEPYITRLRIVFFGNNKEMSQSYSDHRINQMHTVEPQMAQEIEKNGGLIERAPLPRIFAAFFNQNQQPIFASKKIREALALSVDKDRIVKDVLFGYGKTIDGPIPQVIEQMQPLNNASTTRAERIARARKIIEEEGWILNAARIYEKIDKQKKKATLLEFSISIPDVPELQKTAEIMKQNWEEIGAHVTLKIFEPSTFAVEVLAPRKYDILFYGQIVGRTPDMYAYWHSSQRNAPGLNIALYANKDIDKLLLEARKEADALARSILLNKINKEITDDIPAIFIYSPDFLYAVSDNIRGMQTGLITTESERFLDVHNWFIESERVWKWFAQHSKRT